MRQAVFEIIPINDALKTKIKTRDSQVTELLDDLGVQTIKEGMIQFVNQGLTSYEEALPHLISA